LSTAGDQVPEMAFVLVVGRLKASPVQISVIVEKVGIRDSVKLTINSSWLVIVQITLDTTAVIETEPSNVLGVKVVVVEFGFEKLPPDEDHATEAPIPEITAVKSIGAPLHCVMSAIGSIVGAGRTTTVVDEGRAHSPGSGVKTYEVVTVLLIAGDHVPDIPSLLVDGRLKGSPAQMYGINEKLGSVAVGALTTTVFPTEHPVLSITTAV